MKPDNTLICIGHNDTAITRLLQETPSATYEPRFEPDISPDPIITVKSQPLPNFGIQQDARNINVCLIDYSHGKRSRMRAMMPYLFCCLQQRPLKKIYESKFNPFSSVLQK